MDTKMIITQKIEEVREQIKKWKREGDQIGFVPTMGYLHEGHQSLIECARRENEKVVVSIFVNPTQFSPTEDLEQYPRDLKRDVICCEEAGADLIFCPEVSEMYPEKSKIHFAVETLSKELCAKSRPTHFQGVCLVVSKLFHIVGPDRAYFGQKDAQQLAVIKRMVKDLNFDIEIIGCPIVRESDGLAKSSRNIYLSEEERKAAVVLSQALMLGKHTILKGETNAEFVENIVAKEIAKEKLARIDYVEVVDFDTVQKIDEIRGTILIAVAVYIGKTRLIDNVIMKG